MDFAIVSTPTAAASLLDVIMEPLYPTRCTVSPSRLGINRKMLCGRAKMDALRAACFHPPNLRVLSHAAKLVEREIPSHSAISTRIASSF